MSYFVFIRTLIIFWLLGVFITTEWNTVLWDSEFRFWIGIIALIVAAFVTTLSTPSPQMVETKRRVTRTFEDDDI